jgi:WD40 repeat protein
MRVLFCNLRLKNKKKNPGKKMGLDFFRYDPSGNGSVLITGSDDEVESRDLVMYISTMNNARSYANPNIVVMTPNETVRKEYEHMTSADMISDFDHDRLVRIIDSQTSRENVEKESFVIVLDQCREIAENREFRDTVRHMVINGRHMNITVVMYLDEAHVSPTDLFWFKYIICPPNLISTRNSLKHCDKNISRSRQIARCPGALMVLSRGHGGKRVVQWAKFFKPRTPRYRDTHILRYEDFNDYSASYILADIMINGIATDESEDLYEPYYCMTLKEDRRLIVASSAPPAEESRIEIPVESRVRGYITSSHDGAYLYSTHEDGSKNIWDAHTGALWLALPKSVNDCFLSFTADSRTVFALDNSNTNSIHVQIWDLEARAQTETLHLDAYDYGRADILTVRSSLDASHIVVLARLQPREGWSRDDAMVVDVWKVAANNQMRRIRLPTDWSCHGDGHVYLSQTNALFVDGKQVIANCCFPNEDRSGAGVVADHTFAINKNS